MRTSRLDAIIIAKVGVALMLIPIIFLFTKSMYTFIRSYQDEIDLLCEEEQPDGITDHNKEVFNKICSNNDYSSFDDFYDLCEILGEQNVCDTLEINMMRNLDNLEF